MSNSRVGRPITSMETSDLQAADLHGLESQATSSHATDFTATGSVAEDLLVLEQSLYAWLAECSGAVVAFSGGVDSAVVAYAAQHVLGSRSLAATADSASLARHELTDACNVAAQIGIALRLVATDEVADPAYLKNDAQRCFHCKSHLFQSLGQIDEVRSGGWQILTGTNRDDLGDWRPGLRAADQYGARSPLAELGIGKEQVRALAQRWKLSVADKPASPCLSSRLAYGVEVTPERLAMIEAAEAELRLLGLVRLRVRFHEGNLARVEVPLDQLSTLIDTDIRRRLVKRFGQIGFKFITLDLEGFASGSLNRLIALSSSPPGV